MRILPVLLLLCACTLDPDEDGLNAREEKAAGTDKQNADSDEDGRTDGEEAADGTDPLNADTDGDGRTDGEEAADGTDPLDSDSDDDGLDDGREAELGTDPLDVDTDDDRIGDREEVEDRGTDPLDADSDDDGLDDGDDADAGADPLDPDTDDDNLLDGDEAAAGTHVLDPDSDNDGYLDGDEVTEGTDPTDPLDRIYTGGWPYSSAKADFTPPTDPASLTVGERVPDLALPDAYAESVEVWDLGGRDTPVLLILGSESAELGTLVDGLHAGGGPDVQVLFEATKREELTLSTWLLRTATDQATDVAALNRWYAAHPSGRDVLLADPEGTARAWAGDPAGPTLVLCDATLVVLASAPADDTGLAAIVAALP